MGALKQVMASTECTASVAFIGDIRVVLPCPEDELGPRDTLRLQAYHDCILNAVERGDAQGATRLAIELERSFGVTPDHYLRAHHAATELDQAIELAIQIALTTARQPEPAKKAPKQTRPGTTVELTPKLTNDDLVRRGLLVTWERYKAELNHPNHQTRKNAWDKMADIERELIEGPHRTWLQKALAETMALASSRGEEVEKVDRTGKVRILSRGGLECARRKGNLDDIERSAGECWTQQEAYRIGELYRDCYERAEGHLTPDRAHGATGRREGPQHALLHCGEVLTILRSGQQINDIKALDLICGHDMSINIAAAVTGAHRTTMLKRLRRGIGHAAGNWDGRPRTDQRERREERHLIGDMVGRAARSV